MKITKRHLQKLIKEESIKALRESYMKQRFTEMSDIVIAVIEDEPGINGTGLVAVVSEEYPYNSNEMPVDKEEVYTILDVLIEEEQVFFDTQEDAWYIAGSPEALSVIGVHDAESEFIDHGIHGREMSKGR